MKIQPLVNPSRLHSSAPYQAPIGRLHHQDSITPYPEQGGRAYKPMTFTSALRAISDLFQCVKFFFIATFHNLHQTTFSCFSRLKALDSAPEAKVHEPTHAVTQAAHSSVAGAVRTISISPGIAMALPAPAPGPAHSALPIDAAEDIAFNSLDRSLVDEEHIHFIVHTLATVIFLPAAELKERGSATHHLHPMRFLEYILKNPELAQDFANLQRRVSSVSIMQRPLTLMIWNEFSSQLSRKLHSHFDAGTLLCHINAFARSTGTSADELRSRITSKNWMGVIGYLIGTIPAPITELGASAPSVTRPTLSALTPSPPLGLAPAPAAAGVTRASAIGGISADRVLSAVGSFPLTGGTTAVAIAELDPLGLEMTEDQRARLRRVITDIAHGNYAVLLWNILSLRADWRALEDVHPFKLLITLFNDPALVANLRTIVADNLKCEEFLNDFAKVLKHGATPDQLRAYSNRFAAHMNVPAAALEDKIMMDRVSDWKDVIRYLLNTRPFASEAVE